MNADPKAFTDALATLEQKGDAGPIAALFADDADLSNPLVQHRYSGPDGAREFWMMYRGAFQSIESQFHHIVSDQDSALLEWTSRGNRQDGQAVEYRGVTVLEYDDAGTIGTFRTYFDPRQLDRPA